MDLESAKALHQQGSLEEAKNLYIDLLKKKPKEVDALHGLGLIAAQQQRFQEAVTYLQKAIAIDSTNATLYLNLANVFKSANQSSAAIDALQQALAINPQYAAALNNLGTIYFIDNQLEKAIEKFIAAIQADENYFEAYYNLGLAYAKQANFSKAITVYQDLLKKAPSHPAANFQLGILFLEAGKISDALQHFLLVEKFHPFHFETQSNIATLYLQSGKNILAKEHYLKALEIEPNDTQVMFNLGVLTMQEGNTDRAIQYYQRVIKNDPDLFAAHNNLGVAFLTKNHIPFALQHFREALRIQPDNTAIEYTVRMLSQDQRLKTSPPEYIKNLFDAYADHYEEHLLQSLEYTIPQILITALEKVITLQANEYTILDLGCGTGLCGEALKPYAKELIGVDLSEKMLAVADNKKIYDALVCSDLNNYLTQETNRFDIIVAGDVLVYIGDLAEIFANIVKALKPNGVFVFNTEISDKSDFAVNQSGRFVHAKSYLENLAKTNHLKISLYEKVITRQQLNQPVYGHLFVLQK